MDELKRRLQNAMLTNLDDPGPIQAYLRFLEREGRRGEVPTLIIETASLDIIQVDYNGNDTISSHFIGIGLSKKSAALDLMNQCHSYFLTFLDDSNEGYEEDDEDWNDIYELKSIIINQVIDPTIEDNDEMTLRFGLNEIGDFIQGRDPESGIYRFTLESREINLV